MTRAILVVHRPAAGRYLTQFRSVVAAATGLGVRPVVLLPTGHRAPEADGLPVHHADLDDTAAVRAAVDGICAEHPIERIFPLFEGDVLSAGRCRRDHGIPGLTPDQALNFRDKNVMHRRAEELGVRVARSCRPDTLSAVEEFAAEVGYPVVVKPYPGWACGNTYRVDGHEELVRVWGELNATVLRDFGMRTGVAHTEFFLRDDGEVVFGEAGARAGGGSIVPAVEAGRGINLAGEWCRLELDPGHRPAARLGPEIGTEYLASGAYGQITAISTPEELKALDGVLDADVWKSVGDVLTPPTASNDVLGWYVCEGTGYDDILNRFKAVRDAFRVETEHV